MKTVRKNKESGSVLAELAFVAPVIMLILSGVITLGQGISQIAWISETAFQAALSGAEHSDEVVAESAMATRADELTAIAQGFSKDAQRLTWRAVSSEQNRPDRLVSVSFEAHFSTFFGGTTVLPLHVGITAPILTNLEANTGNLGTFENPDQPRDCNGNVCSGGSCPTSCLTCSPNGMTCSLS